MRIKNCTTYFLAKKLEESGAKRALHIDTMRHTSQPSQRDDRRQASFNTASMSGQKRVLKPHEEEPQAKKSQRNQPVPLRSVLKSGLIGPPKVRF